METNRVAVAEAQDRRLLIDRDAAIQGHAPETAGQSNRVSSFDNRLMPAEPTRKTSRIVSVSVCKMAFGESASA